MVKKLLAIALLSITSICLAKPPLEPLAEEDTPHYQVEIIVFEPVNDPLQTEALVPDTQLESVYKSIDSFALLEPNRETFVKQPNVPFLVHKLTMKQEARALRRHNRYNVLLHIAWQQPETLDKPVFINNFDSSLSSETIADLNEHLLGLLQIKKHYYFEIKANLALSKHCANSRGNDAKCFVSLKDERRIKEDDINLIDNDRFGMLLKITKSFS